MDTFKIVDALAVASIVSQAGWLLVGVWQPFAYIALAGLIVLLLVSLLGRQLDRAGYFQDRGE